MTKKNQTVGWDFSRFLERTSYFDRLYEDPGHKFGMASSYDRTLANADSVGFIRKEGDKYLMADVQGPGAVVRLWSANPTGKIWVYLDGEEQPVIHTDFRNLFLGKFPPFVEPFVRTPNKNDIRCYHWAYIPIPFAKSCRIYRDTLTFFQAGYVKFSPEIEVEPLVLPLATRHQENLERLSREFSAFGKMPAIVRGEKHAIKISIPPGKTGLIANLDGPAIIRGIRLNWPNMDRQSGRMALFKATWDGEPVPSINIPLADMFGSGFKSLVLGTESGGMGYCYFPMPFRTSAVLNIENEGKETMEINGELIVDKNADLPTSLRTFHASWRRDIETQPVPVRAFERVINPVCDPYYNHLVADIRGRGHYVATMNHRYGRSEGDEFVFVDGESAPGSSPGTGNEDYFDMAWGPRTMDGALAAGIKVMNIHECFRVHLTDAISFERSLRFSFEVFCANTTRYDYDSTAFWYQTEPHAPLPSLLPATARRFRTLDLPPEPEYVCVPDSGSPGWWWETPILPTEGEDLEVISFSGAKPVSVSMIDEGPDWANGAQLLQKAGKEGASFSVRLPSVESDGWHTLRIRWTTGPEYGSVRLKSKLQHKFDEINCHASHRGAIVRDMGAIFRRRNDDGYLSIEAFSSNSKQKSAWVGIDWLSLAPVPHPIVEVEVSGPLKTKSANLSGVGALKWRACPVLPAEPTKPITNKRPVPSSGAIAPADPNATIEQEYILRCSVNVESEGFYRLDWQGYALPPVILMVNNKEFEIDPRRFVVPWDAWDEELPRRFYIPLVAGKNELVWKGSYGAGKWQVPVLMGVKAPVVSSGEVSVNFVPDDH
ncbi:MAG: DUF2961 domain-containing protein [Elusimicrobia bacterium]|nr:DUF2961 domain-containing protein [Elusimicrobiota bacterium]